MTDTTAPQNFALLAMADPKRRAECAAVFALDPHCLVREVESGDEASSVLTSEAGTLREKLGFLVCDWGFPDVSGATFVQRVRTNFVDDDLALIVASSELHPEDHVLLEEIGVTAVVPIEKLADALTDAVNAANAGFSGSRARRGVRKPLEDALRGNDVVALEDALMAFRRSAEDHTLEAKELELVASALIRLKRPDDAVHLLRGALGLEGPSAEWKTAAPKNRVETMRTLGQLGKALCLANKYDEAVLVFDRLAARSPRNFSHAVGYADAALQCADFDAAKVEERVAGVLEEDPENGKANQAMFKAAAAQGDLDRAESFWEKLDPSYRADGATGFFNNRGVALVKVGKVSEALALYNGALRFMTTHLGQVYLNLGLAHLRLGDKPAADEFFRKCIANADPAWLAGKKVLQPILQENKKAAAKKAQPAPAEAAKETEGQAPAASIEATGEEQLDEGENGMDALMKGAG